MLVMERSNAPLSHDLRDENESMYDNEGSLDGADVIGDPIHLPFSHRYGEMAVAAFAEESQTVALGEGFPATPCWTQPERTTRQFRMPDLYSSPSTMQRNPEAATNTSPAEHDINSDMNTLIGKRRLNDSNSPTKMLEQIHHKRAPSGQEQYVDAKLPFPVKLHYILSNPKYQSYISWIRHGRAWRVLKPKEFEEKVIPAFFRSAKYASFMRQVNGWAFTRITEGPDLNAYYHEMFLRGLPNLCLKMKRPPKVRNAASTARNAAGAGFGTPNFYRIEKIAPLPLSMPFKLVPKQTKDETAGYIPKYFLAPLDVTTDTDDSIYGNNDGFEMQFDEQLLSQHSDQGAGEFENPFEANTALSGDVKGSVATLRAQGQKNEQVGEQTSNGKRWELSSSAQSKDWRNESLLLSKADVNYLAHQNSIIKAFLESEK